MSAKSVQKTQIDKKYFQFKSDDNKSFSNLKIYFNKCFAIYLFEQRFAGKGTFK